MDLNELQKEILDLKTKRDQLRLEVRLDQDKLAYKRNQMEMAEEHLADLKQLWDHEIEL